MKSTYPSEGAIMLDLPDDTLPPLKESNRLANAIQQAVRDQHWDGGYRLCHIISGATSIVLSAFAPTRNGKRVQYNVRANWAELVISKKLRQWCFKDQLTSCPDLWESSCKDFGDNAPYHWPVQHTWVEAYRGDWELVDLSTFFYQKLFDEYGADCSFSPQFFWDWKTKAPRGFRDYWYAGDDYQSRRMLQALYEDKGWRGKIQAIVRRAITILEPQGYSAPPNLWPAWMLSRFPDVENHSKTESQASACRPWRPPPCRFTPHFHLGY
jgi:hypothetical protein